MSVGLGRAGVRSVCLADNYAKQTMASIELGGTFTFLSSFQTG